MNKNDLEFSVIAVDQNNLQSFIVFEIDHISSIVRKTNVGQFIQSEPFELNFPKSIGISKWIVLLFPNGQYEAGQPNDMINIYLKIVECEHPFADYKFDVEFQLGSEYAKISKKDQRLCFANVRTRWMGTKLISTMEMIVNGSQFIRDDVLMLSVLLDEHTKYEKSMETNYNNNNYSFKIEPYAQTGNQNYGVTEHSTPKLSSAEESYNHYLMNKEKPDYAHTEKMTIDDDNPPARSISPQNRDRNPNSSTTVYNIYPNQWQSYDSASASRSGQTYGRNLIRDSNLHYVEYSDDEDSPEKQEKTSSGGLGKIINSVVSLFKNRKAN